MQTIGNLPRMADKSTYYPIRQQSTGSILH